MDIDISTLELMREKEEEGLEEIKISDESEDLEINQLNGEIELEKVRGRDFDEDEVTPKNVQEEIEEERIRKLT